VEITMIWSATILAAGYCLIQERVHASNPSFDFSDTVDLIIAASVGRLESEFFCEGDGNKVDNSEDITVRFEDVPDGVGRRISKRLVTVIPEPPFSTSTRVPLDVDTRTSISQSTMGA
jgi:hypothetical protein